MPLPLQPSLEQYEEEREHARERVQQAARRGESPSVAFAADDLSWAFTGRDDELAQLEQEAEAARLADIERRRRRVQQHELEAETAKVLSEWAKAEAAERLQKAQAEARRRLSLHQADR